jgi:predicted AAA+ superfamily ATPase
MEKSKLRELLIEHRERFLSRRGLIRREIQKKLERHIRHKEVILITGVRRGGKSSLMRLICEDITARLNVPLSNILYLNFEDERLIDFTVKDFEVIEEIFFEMENPKGKRFFFLDEIQNVMGWEKWVNRLYEFEDVKVFVTGSNASMLGSKISTALTGRNRQIINWPFSFAEYLGLREYPLGDKSFYLREKRAEIKRLFGEYCNMGGFPEILKARDTELLKQYFADIIYRDIIAGYSIKNVKEIKELALFLASNLGTVQSYKNMKNLIGVKSINTVKNYLEALSDVFLFFGVDLFDFSIKRQIYNPSKNYCIDTALSNAISFKFSRNLGHLYENLVFLELKRRDEDVFYWKSKRTHHEVDFVTKRGMKIDKAIQVAVSLSDKKVREREIRALLETRDALTPNHLIILTEDEEGEEIIGDAAIKISPIWKWLLLDKL